MLQTTEPKAALTALSSIEGVMEGVQDGALSGWVWDADAPGMPLTVELVGPGFYHRVVAEGYRVDLADARKRGGACWFTVALPDGYGQTEEVVALLAGTPHRVHPVGDGRLAVDAFWLEGQTPEVRRAADVQRIAYGLGCQPLDGAEVDAVLASVPAESQDLAELVAAVRARS